MSPDEISVATRILLLGNAAMWGLISFASLDYAEKAQSPKQLFVAQVASLGSTFMAVANGFAAFR